MAVDNIDNLYQIYDVLSSAGEKISEHEDKYVTLLEAVKGTDKEKRLASQFIPKFFKHFTNLIDRSIESQFDLCEDEDVLIRKQAVRDLPNFCRENKDFTRKIADILAQLLQVEDSAELNVVYNALMSIFKIEAKGTLTGLFNQILTGEELVRDRCIRFLANKYRQLGSDIINKEAEDLVIAETKKVLQDVTAEEFRVLMGVLAQTRLGSSVSGHQELVALVSEQAELDQPFGTPDSENVDRLIACTRHALPYFSTQVESTKFVNYMCEEVLPMLADLPRHVVEGGGGSDTTLEILKLMAELCSHVGTLEQASTKLEHIFQKLLEYMPLPPEGESVEDKEGTEPKLEFSYVECLLYTLHRLGRQCPEFLADNADRLKDFRMRLQYFARGAQGYMKKLKEVLNKKKAGVKEGDEERNLQAAALQTTSNILLLIKDLFHTPPSYKSTVTLSWVTSVTKDQKKDGSIGGKRHTPITFGNGTPAKHARTDRGDRVIYQPPSGKYSEKISGYAPSNTWRGGRGGRSRGGFRGNRGWRNSY